MRSVIRFLALTACFAFGSVHATDLSATDSRALISAFKTAGLTGQPSLNKGVTYNFDLACHVSDGMDKDPMTAEYGISSYLCDVGAGKIFLARAKVIFDTMAPIFGTGQNGAMTDSMAMGLSCSVNLEDANIASRFSCSYNSK
jgi:hypothetical protein